MLIKFCSLWASTPQPDCTAIYCLSSTEKVTGTPMTHELVGYSHRISPFLESKALNLRSFVPPMNTRSPAVARIDPQLWLSNVVVHARSPVSTFHACSSPIWFAPSRTKNPPLSDVPRPI